MKNELRSLTTPIRKPLCVMVGATCERKVYSRVLYECKNSLNLPLFR